MKNLFMSLSILFSSCVARVPSGINPDLEFTLNERNDFLLAKSEIDQSSILDRNRDGRPDVARWYKGSGFAFEKIDSDYDGFWDWVVGKNAAGEVVSQYIKYQDKEDPVSDMAFFIAGMQHPYVVRAR